MKRVLWLTCLVGAGCAKAGIAGVSGGVEVQALGGQDADNVVVVFFPGEVACPKIAEFKNGTLTVTLPKKEAAKPRQIKVEVKA
jgi:hypothetical protein